MTMVRINNNPEWEGNNEDESLKRRQHTERSGFHI